MRVGWVLGKKECILDYAKKQIPKNLFELSFSVIKNEEQFRSSYAMHDLATNYAACEYLQNGFLLCPLGVDLRKHQVIIENELPDYLAEKDSDLFCFDVKSKSSTKTFGWVNERAAISYRRLAKGCSVQTYMVFVQVVAGTIIGKTGNCNIEDDPITKRKAWDGNSVLVFDWKDGLPHLR